MVKLDVHEVKIIKELIKNPRNSDNKISKNTKIPVMTVNRKRKNLEKLGIIKYYTSIHHGQAGTEDHNAKQLYIIKFKAGVTKAEFLKKNLSDVKLKKFYPEHITLSYLGEKDGHFALMIILNARTETELVECFNGEIIPRFKKNFGSDAIMDISTFRISESLRVHHNYLPKINIENGIMKKDWPEEYIFVNKESFYTEEQKNFVDYKH